VRKRLRKKKRLGEFKEYGFEIAFRIRESAQSNPIFNAFIVEAIEGNGLQFGGSPDGGFAAANAARASATEEHRAQVRAWLQRQPEVTDIRVGELRDAWHGWGSV